ncbi:hypothetical protein HMPREF1870_00562 [Bacteroidales bacterium KA00344]|nr:hypothetical protein HMPREF1870_00562 [Bacteroidales bacterium KA00344]
MSFGRKYAKFGGICSGLTVSGLAKKPQFPLLDCLRLTIEWRGEKGLTAGRIGCIRDAVEA